jgi:hypothetical protein
VFFGVSAFHQHTVGSELLLCPDTILLLSSFLCALALPPSTSAVDYIHSCLHTLTDSLVPPPPNATSRLDTYSVPSVFRCFLPCPSALGKAAPRPPCRLVDFQD